MVKTNIPEVVENKKEENKDSIFLRTVLRRDVHERLKDFARGYSTGRGDWDFGVAVQILLNHYEQSQQAVILEKIDMIGAMLEQREEPPEEKEDDTIELLGGKKIKK